ncbi:MAG: phosphoglycerate mutase family protein [Ilumatobacteraceae bacterium]
MLYLVRHAKAGSRHDWDGDDQLRPLTKSGQRQATALARQLVRRDATVLVSSPYTRCVQTLEPLAHLLREPVHTDDRLAEGGDFSGVLELLAALPDGAVLCSHGDVIPTVIAAMQRRGCEISGAPDWRKGSVWVLHRDDETQFTSAKAWPPPEA